jgi:small subunit ribosomal protein S8
MDSIGNFLTIIRNGLIIGKRTVEVPYSKITYDIATVLKNEGFIGGLDLSQEENRKRIKVILKYSNGESVIHSIERISKPSLRQYSSAKNIKPVIGKLGISILTTSKGIMTDKQAKAQSIGGEILCSVW